jgi:cobalamin biosynthesis protein CobT
MFTDGFPTDDATVLVQMGDFLKDHFEHVVRTNNRGKRGLC